VKDESTNLGGQATGATKAPGVPAAVDRATFEADLERLRVREKAHTREGDAIAAARRRLPMGTSWVGTCRGTRHRTPSTRSGSGAESA
jgi:hypothetical protein